MVAPIKRISWWVAVVLAVMLPFSFDWTLKNLGGYVTGWIFYGSYRDLLSLVFLLTALLIGWLMTKPSEYIGLRFTFAFVSIIVCLLAAIAPRPMCEEKVFLKAMGAKQSTQIVYKDNCEP
jgi:hypothetical protein